MIHINFVSWRQRRRSKFWLRLALYNFVVIIIITLLLLFWSNNLQKKITAKVAEATFLKTVITDFTDLTTINKVLERQLQVKEQANNTALELIKIHNKLSTINTKDIVLNSLDKHDKILVIEATANGLDGVSKYVALVEKLDIFSDVTILKINNLDNSANKRVLINAELSY